MNSKIDDSLKELNKYD